MFKALFFAAFALASTTSTIPALSGSAIDITSGRGGTYPRATFLSDGSILGSYAATVGNNSQLTLVTSHDNGASWSFLGTAATRNNPTSDLDNPYPLQLPSGRILLAYRNHDVDPSTNNPTVFRITLSSSDDNGHTWSFLSEPEAYPACTYACGSWEPFLRLAQDGTLQLYYSKENAADDQDSLLRTSTDGGETWSAAQTISGADVTARDGMVGVATVDGRNLIAVFESFQNGVFTIDSVSSPDDGVTWPLESRKRVYAPTGTDNNAGAPQIVSVGGTLVVSFMTDEDTQLHEWFTGAGAKLITSGDGGASWGNKLEVFEPQANWPGMLALDDSSLLYLADHSGAKSQKVVLS